MEDEEGLKEFSALMKLEPFQRGMKELAPTSLDHGAAQGAEPESRRTRHRLARRQFRHPEGQPGVLPGRRGHGAYLEEHNLPNEWDYFDPAKADEKRECGLHAAWGGEAIRG